MKRAIILILALLMVLSCFAGCGGQTADKPASDGTDSTKSLVVTNTSATGHWRVQSVDVYYTD